MIQTRYYKLKLILAPVIAGATYMAGDDYWSEPVRSTAGLIGVALTALWALVNEVPRANPPEAPAPVELTVTEGGQS